MPLVTSVGYARRRSLGDSHVFVCRAVVTQKAVLPHHLYHSLNKNYIRHLADFLPFFFWGEDGLVGARNQFAGIVAVENGDTSAVHKMVVGAVVDEQDAARGEERRGTGFDDARVKHARAARENGRFGSFGPVKQIVRIGEAHLVGLVGGGAEPVHPILAVDFCGGDGARLGPTFVPVSFVSRKNHAFALPVEQVARGGQAELRVLFVVAGIGEVIGVTEFLQARIFDAAIFFVVSFGGEYWLEAASEVDAGGAFGVGEA